MSSHSFSMARRLASRFKINDIITTRSFSTSVSHSSSIIGLGSFPFRKRSGFLGIPHDLRAIGAFHRPLKIPSTLPCDSLPSCLSPAHALYNSRFHSTGYRPLVTGTPSKSTNKLPIWILLSTTCTVLLCNSYAKKQHASSIIHGNTTSISLQNSNLEHSVSKKKASRTVYIWKAILTYVIEPLATARRFLYLLVLFLPVLAVSPVLLLEYVELGHPAKRRKKNKNGKLITERRCTIWWYNLLVSSMQRAGPTFIKLAQWAGSRTDLFPATLCESFGKLHSNGKPHSMQHTRLVLEKAFGKKFEDIFTSFNPEPLGIGAVAQVYKATLRSDLLPLSYLTPKHQDAEAQLTVTDLSRKLSNSQACPPSIKPSPTLAIKVLHPRVAQNIRRDLKIMAFFANLINCFPGAEWLSFPEEVEVFGNLMKSQIDLTLEAENLDRFEKNFTHRKTVGFPRPLKSYSTKNVLVEEFEDALPLKYFLREGGGPFDHRISDIGLDAFLHMLLIDNFVHADLHPGNIMVRFYKPTAKNIIQSIWRKFTNIADVDAGEENAQLTQDVVHKLRKISCDHTAWNLELERLDKEGYQPELVFIDSGLITELNEVNRKNFLDLFEAIASFDGHRAGKLMVERCRTPDLVIDEETFALKIHHLALNVKSQTFSLSKIRISDVLVNVLNSVREHHVKLEADFINTILSILLLEGIGRQLNPELDLFQSALPILRSLGSQMNTMDTIYQGISTKHIGSMVKIWFWIEARHIASIAVAEVDSMLRYDLLMPNI